MAQRVRALRDDDDLVSAGREQIGERTGDLLVVIDDEAPQRSYAGERRLGRGTCGLPEVGTLRKPQTDGRAPARLALDDDPSAMARDDPVRDRQPESRALGSFGREERVEQLLANFLGHPDPGVLDPRLHLRVVRRGAEPQTTALRHRIHGVQNEIRHHLAQLDRVTTDRGKRGQRRLDGNDDAPALRVLSPSGLGDFEGAANDLIEVDRDERLIASDSREFLEAAHGLGAIIGGPLDGLEPPFLDGVVDATEEELRAAGDRRQQVVEVVRDPGRHLPERAQLFRPQQAVLSRRELGIRLAALLE